MYGGKETGYDVVVEVLGDAAKEHQSDPSFYLIVAMYGGKEAGYDVVVEVLVLGHLVHALPLVWLHFLLHGSCRLWFLSWDILYTLSHSSGFIFSFMAAADSGSCPGTSCTRSPTRLASFSPSWQLQTLVRRHHRQALLCHSSTLHMQGMPFCNGGLALQDSSGL